MKTAELIAACCEMGGIAVLANEQQRRALRDYGLALGIHHILAQRLPVQLALSAMNHFNGGERWQ